MAFIQLPWLTLRTVSAAQVAELQALTTLSNPSFTYMVLHKTYLMLSRGDIEAVIVDNQAVNDDVLSAHRHGYNGVASLKFTQRRENLFVPFFRAQLGESP